MLLESQTWLISDRCTKLIEAIPQMIRDEKKQEEMLKVDWNEAQIGDDPVDSAGTGLQWMVGSTAKPDAVLLEESFHAERLKFVARAEKAKPGEDWFKGFGGKPATHREKKK
jgi:hypothetical protein